MMKYVCILKTFRISITYIRCVKYLSIYHELSRICAGMHMLIVSIPTYLDFHSKCSSQKGLYVTICKKLYFTVSLLVFVS